MIYIILIPPSTLTAPTVAMEHTELATAPKTARKSPKRGSTAAQPQLDSTSATRQVRRSPAVPREGKNCSVLRKMRNKELGKVSNNLIFLLTH